MIRAWHIFDGDPFESSLLIFAGSANRARYMAQHAGLWDYQEYSRIRARRAPKWDSIADAERVIEFNEELPDGAPAFYSEEDEL